MLGFHGKMEEEEGVVVGVVDRCWAVKAMIQ